jgi:hypothetical protein
MGILLKQRERGIFSLLVGRLSFNSSAETVGEVPRECAGRHASRRWPPLRCLSTQSLHSTPAWTR